MTFENFVANSQAIFKSFPNEQVWIQGGFIPNRQLQKPEAGYCVVIRYDEKTTNAISRFMTRIQGVLPPIVEYSERSFHTTIGVYGKGDLQGFISDLAVLKYLAKSVEKGLMDCPKNPCVEFGQWLYNNEAILVSGYPNQDLWCLSQNIRNACQENGVPIEMGRIIHITTARFISGVTRQVFEQFMLEMKSAPPIGNIRPSAIELATWHCDGLTFGIVTHKHYPL
jgi:hypothetical protein